MYYLYIKTHRVTGLKYFGFTTKNNVHKYKGSGKHWLRHIKKHGYDVDTEIVGVFENIDDGEIFALKFSEENNIVESKEWANLQKENCRIDIVFTDEIRQKISESNKGRIVSSETRKKMSDLRQGTCKGEENPFFGKHHTEETKEKNRQAHVGKKLSEETRQKMKGRASSFLGKQHSEETKAKMRETRKRQVFSQETKRKISESLKGRKMSKEFCEKLSGKNNYFFGRPMNEKKWLIFHPDGKEEIITNLRKFCMIHNLHYSAMIGVSQGKCKQHKKGWKCKKLEETI